MSVSGQHTTLLLGTPILRARPEACLTPALVPSIATGFSKTQILSGTYYREFGESNYVRLTIYFDVLGDSFSRYIH